MTFTEIKNHVLEKIESSDVTQYPFYNIYITNIFPINFYEKLKERMLYFKYNENLQDRNWDNPDFMNKKFSLRDIDDDVINLIREVFNDVDIKNSIMSKFYYENWTDEIEFNRDLQFVFTGKNKFQRIHTDIPAQFVSVNFYLPENELTQQEELDNGTLLYDKELNPCKVSRFVSNSVSFFAPHFYSYHGFDTTIDNRNTLLFFYAQKDLVKRFYDNSKNQNSEQDPDKFKDLIQWKISKYRLIEYGSDDMEFLTKLIQEKSDCKVNELNGRITKDLH
jgi:hypothetical protein